MSIARRHPGGQRAARSVLLALHGIVALNAFAGAWYGLAGAEGVPRSWLRDTPFDSYVVPSLVLGVVVGGTQLLALVALALRWRWAQHAVLVASFVLVAWIVVQVSMIGLVSWLQPTMLAVALACAALATYGNSASTVR